MEILEKPTGGQSNTYSVIVDYGLDYAEDLLDIICAHGYLRLANCNYPAWLGLHSEYDLTRPFDALWVRRIEDDGKTWQSTHLYWRRHRMYLCRKNR